MRFIKVSLEEENQNTQDGEKVNIDPNKTQEAIDAVESKDSTDPEKVIKVANYTEELAKIRQKNKDENPEDQDQSQEPTQDSNDDEDGENNSDDSEETTEEEPQSNDGDSDAQPEESSPSDEEVATEHYMQQNMKQTFAALETLTELSKYKDMVERKLKVGGINQATALIVQNNVQACAQRVGFTFKKELPALESYTGFTSNTINTKELNVAIESLITGIWEAIKKFFKTIWNWILEILGIRKSSDSKGKVVSSKEERTKREEAAINAAKNLEEKLKKIDLARERDAEKNKKALQDEMSESIANHLFCSNDVGTFSEILLNGENIAAGLKACEEFVKRVKEINEKNVPLIYDKFQEPALQDYCIKNDVIGSLKVRETIKGNDSSTFVFVTEEVVAGVGFEFILSDPSVIVKQATSITAKQGFLKEISKQSFGLAKINVNNKKNNRKKVPLLDQNERANLNNIAKNIKDHNTILTGTIKIFEDLAKGIKTFTELPDPPSWTSQQGTLNYNEKIAYFKKLLTLSAAIVANFSPAVLKLDRLVANFCNNFAKIDSLYS